MGRGFSTSIGAPALAPSLAPPTVSTDGVADRDSQWRSFDNYVDAVSFGFVATAILISMFIVLAIFERFIRARSSASGRIPSGVEPRKPNCPSPKISVYPNGVSVLMPGEQIPTFIAHPAPAPCPPEPVSPSILDHDKFPVSASR